MVIINANDEPFDSLDRKLTHPRRGRFGDRFFSDSFNGGCSSRSDSDAWSSGTTSEDVKATSCSSLDSSDASMDNVMSIQPAAGTEEGEEGGEDDLESGKPCKYGFIGSLLREAGHVYSLAASGEFLYTGSDSKNVRIWKGLRGFSGLKSGSGLVKAIVLFGDKIFTGHQDGKIRVWRFSGDDMNTHKRVGNLPTTQDLLRNSLNPRNYVEVRKHLSVPWVKHYDAVSCMSVDADQGLLYSGSWDKSVKVWRISDSKCLESFQAHDDAVNSLSVAFEGLVFTCSADGTVKTWRRELVGNHTKHTLVARLLNQGQALTSLAVSHAARMVYVGSSDGLVSFWEREKQCMSYGGVLRGHKLAVLCLAVGGNLVLSGSADRSICVWRREFGGAHVFVAVLTGHTGPVKCLAVQKEAAADDEDKRWVVYSGSLDKSVKVWRVSELPDTSTDLDNSDGRSPVSKELVARRVSAASSIDAPPSRTTENTSTVGSSINLNVIISIKYK